MSKTFSNIKGDVFGSASHFQMLAKQVPETAVYVVVRMEKVPYIDQSGLYTIENAFLDLEKKNIHPLIVDIQKQPLYLLQSIDIVPDLISKEHLFNNFNDCTEWIKNNVKN